MARPLVAITIGHKYYTRMICNSCLSALESVADIRHTGTDDPADTEGLKRLLKDADACITSWEVAQIDREVLHAAPRLKAVVHMGGSVRKVVTSEVFDRGIRVFGASPVLAETVAESTLGMMIIGMKRGFEIAHHTASGGWRDASCWPPRELRGKTVGIIGASQVGRHVIELLAPFHVTILVCDPYLDGAGADALGVEKVDMEELLFRSDIVSLHAPAKESTRHMLNRNSFRKMKDNALIINTARGTLIEEPALVEELQKGRFRAVLDVTDPEPPAPDSPLRTLPNVTLLPHIAGCIEDCSDLSKRASEELRRFFAGEEPLYEITTDMFERIS